MARQPWGSPIPGSGTLFAKAACSIVGARQLSPGDYTAPAALAIQLCIAIPARGRRMPNDKYMASTALQFGPGAYRIGI
jgi:hypothetical protein